MGREVAPAQTPPEIAEPQGSRQCQTLLIARVFNWQFGHRLLLGFLQGGWGWGWHWSLRVPPSAAIATARWAPNHASPRLCPDQRRAGAKGREAQWGHPGAVASGWQSWGQGSELPDSQPRAFSMALLHRPSEHLPAPTAPLGRSLLSGAEAVQSTEHPELTGEHPPPSWGRGSQPGPPGTAGTPPHCHRPFCLCFANSVRGKGVGPNPGSATSQLCGPGLVM